MGPAPCMASPTFPQTCTLPRPGRRYCLALEAHPTTIMHAAELQTGLAWADPRVEGGMWTTVARMKGAVYIKAWGREG